MASSDRGRENLRTPFSPLLRAMAIVLTFFLVPILFVMHLANAYKSSPVCLLASTLPLAIFATKFFRILVKLVKKDQDLVLKYFIVAGRGLKLKTLTLKAYLLLFVVHLLASATVFTALHAILHKVEILHVVLVAVLGMTAAFLYHYTRLFLAFSTSSRKTAIGVEAPYFLALVKVLSSITMPFYDILTAVENSASLRVFSKEIKFARKISTIKNLSLITALDTVCSNHPSEIMREHIRRVAIAASTMGDIKSSAESAFEAVYTMFETKVAKLVERFTIVIGSALFAYLFIPVIAATVAPVIGGATLQIIVFTLSFQILVFFVLYSISTSYYPSSLAVIYTPKLLVITVAPLTLVLSLSMYNMLSHLMGFRALEHTSLYIALVTSLIPGLIASERSYRKVVLYDKFTRIASDAASLATATGENYLLVLERVASKHGKTMSRFVRRIATSYASDPLRKVIVASAPTLFHASFTETLMYVLLYGSSPAMLKSFTTSYERIITLVSRIRSMALTIEIMMVGLSAVIGGFLAYLSKVFEGIARLAEEAGAPGMGLSRFFAYDPAIYGLLDAVTLLSLILISIFVGKMRGGIVAFSFRTAIMALTVYYVSKTFVHMFIY